MIKFLLENTAHEPGAIDPHVSVLDYLREVLHNKGTKEGCASGDCGACTVVIAEAVGGKLQYKSVNACITPLATLHGKQLLTVEHLRDGRELHPVQRAMVDCHGSQCGFCTPGFVMSMFAYRKNHAQPERHSINVALGGNLCRCTGYRPILDAAVQMYEPAIDDQFSRLQARTVQALEAIAAQGLDISVQQGNKCYFAPAGIDGLASLLQRYPAAKLLAGGTDLCLEFTQLLREYDVLIYTGRVAELLCIREDDEEFEIGAAVSYTACASLLATHYPDTLELLERLGSLQIRNQGTLGGNVANASPIGDMPPVLLALGAKLRLRCGDQSRLLPVQDYYISYKVTALRPAEFIESIILPRPADGYQFRVYKISKRLEDDISATCGAFSIRIEAGMVADARVAFGGMAAIPARAWHCEKALVGQPWNQQTVASAMAALASDFQPISDFRASADYRLRVSQNMLRRLLLELDGTSSDAVRVTRYA